MARLVGTTAKAVRVYEARGLLVPGPGRGRYGDEDLLRLKLIVTLRRVGFPMRRIRRLLELQGKNGDLAGETAQRLADEVSEIVAEVTNQIEVLSRLRLDLITTRENLYHCVGCKDPVERCRICPGPDRMDSHARVLIRGL